MNVEWKFRNQIIFFGLGAFTFGRLMLGLLLVTRRRVLLFRW